MSDSNMMSDSNFQIQVERAARALGNSGSGVALTGAGLSVASGVPDFRGSSGLWERFSPAEYATVDAFVSDPDKVWFMFRAVDAILATAKPAAGHTALAQLEKLGAVVGVITQNIDGLQQKAGSKNVVEYHGNARELQCIGCGSVYPAKRRKKAAPDKAPRCRCGNALKPAVVLFGEMLPLKAIADAKQLIAESDLLLVVGTSANVAPASELPFDAKANGAQIIEFNVEPTELTGRISDIFVQGPAEKTLPEVVAMMRRLGC